MSLRIDRGDPRTSSTASGRCFVYVLPCRETDLVKIGFSRTPLQRLQTLHARYFEYFDIDAGALIETERVRDARRIERDFLCAFAPQRAPAPHAVSRAAAGHTEWHAGVQVAALERARALCAATGLRLHMPLRDWLCGEVAARLDLLHDWSVAMLDAIEYEQFNLPALEQRGAHAAALRDALDACTAFGLPLEPVLPGAVQRWYRATIGQGCLIHSNHSP